LILAAAFVVAGCAVQTPTGSAFRQATAPIWSAAAFQPSAIGGRWQQAAVFASASDPGCQPGRLEFSPAPEGLVVSGVLCLDGDLQRVSGMAEPVGPGRLRIRGQEDWWVLWVDSGYRTLAVGTPSGRFGFVLDRGTIPPDRLEATREIFDFNGYATGALRKL
jgi:apolipoprotein D and lipocalin family protein